MTLLEIGKLTEEQARQYIEKQRWPNGAECPHCQNKGEQGLISSLKGESHRAGLYYCGACRKQFSATVGTIMEDSHLSAKQWLTAFHLMSSSKKGVSALQLQRELGIGSYKTAWFLAHRIREAMNDNPLSGLLQAKLSGKVEVDETYIGGKPRKGSGQEHKRGRGTKKAAVMVLVERNGKAHSRPVGKVNSKTLKGAIRQMVDKNSTIYTDEWTAYQGIGKEFDGGHEIVNHKQGEYVRGEANTNTAESYIALMKRGVNGIFHHVSKQHLHRYCNEFSFRWDNRKVDDGQRRENAIKGVSGKRLMYKEKMA